jgi:hypothetical protein
MSRLMFAPPAGRSRGRRSPESCAPSREEPRLGEFVSAIWSELLATGTTRCPICHGRMDSGGRCGRCGSRLS